MKIPFFGKKEPEPKPAGCRRQTGRRMQEALTCDLGDVLDISRGGMRVIGNKHAKGELEVTINAFDGDFTIQCRVARSQRRSLTTVELGLEFVDVSPEQAKRLTEIATTHSRVDRLAG